MTSAVPLSQVAVHLRPEDNIAVAARPLQPDQTLSSGGGTRPLWSRTGRELFYYVAPDTIPNFEKEFGVRVRYATYESNEEMLAKVQSGNSGWDVVFPTHSRLEPMRAYGLVAPLRHEWLSGLFNLDPRCRAPAWDPELQWGVPYMWNGTGIVYNRGVQTAPTRWADLWNPGLKGRLTMLDDPEDMLGACLKKLGLPFSATSPDQLRLAQQQAIAQKPLLRAYLNAEVRDQLVAGDVPMPIGTAPAESAAS